jgi:hypothetical protein
MLTFRKMQKKMVWEKRAPQKKEILSGKRLDAVSAHANKTERGVKKTAAGLRSATAFQKPVALRGCRSGRDTQPAGQCRRIR